MQECWSFEAVGRPSFAQLSSFLDDHSEEESNAPRRNPVISRQEMALAYSMKQSHLQNPENWEIDPIDIKMNEEVLGKGHFGEVYKASLHGRIVAVKTIKPGAPMTEEQFIKEAETTRFLSHENIVRTIGVCSYKPYIVIEFLPGGSLKKYLNNLNVRNITLSPTENLEIARQIACAMTHLEKNNYIHRDLAARNILVG
ncbi:hypothetical protein PENTCL1PPCAC_9144 [Pristionchus entomophagus]|uniref:Protein kinase domain-containing protein n=1 Tax=Pristionchus entomophagus TaxID=358040 RepID=A0AAV5T063_9BILA|nr:hypothetical protein PENTCL1PPCAC_9144 [Pristionchus entomophagus]